MKHRTDSDRALWEREAQFRLFFVHSLEAIFLTAPDGSILNANPEACRLFGRTVEEFQAVGRSGVVDVTDPRLPAALEERARTGIFRGELRALRKDGSRLECDVSSVIFKDHHGELRTHTVMRDITARKRAESELLRHQAEVARLQRLQAAGALAALLAHDLNQPLAAIANYAEASRGQVGRRGGREKQQSNLDQIIQQAHRASDIIRKLGQFLRKGESSPVPADLAVVVRGACALLKGLADARGVRLDCSIEAELPHVAAQPTQIEQVLVNLLQNALDAIVSATETDRCVVAVRAWHQEGEDLVRIGVEDSGPGVDAGLVERIFEPLYTTKANGLGLGLTLCRSIVEANGGKMWAEPGPGGKFYFTLPAAHD